MSTFGSLAPVTPRREAAPPAAVDCLPEILGNLYRQQLALDPHDPYLQEHGGGRCVVNQVRTFCWYAPYLPPQGRVLDWGCNHAPDSCLLRARFGRQLELHGCDFGEPDRYRLFHRFADLQYQQLKDPITLGYGQDTFDVVISSGALEHAAMDYESLKEIYRVLKPDGLLIVTYLPNWLSYREWLRRVIHRQQFHRRLYGLGETRQLLKRSGLYPIRAGYHTFFWENALGVTGTRHNRWLVDGLPRLLPAHWFCSTLCFLARKVISM